MAFNALLIGEISAGVATSIGRFFSYKTTVDSFSDCVASDYFDGMRLRFNVSDIVYIIASDTVGIVSVTAVTPAVTVALLHEDTHNQVVIPVPGLTSGVLQEKYVRVPFKCNLGFAMGINSGALANDTNVQIVAKLNGSAVPSSTMVLLRDSAAGQAGASDVFGFKTADSADILSAEVTQTNGNDVELTYHVIVQPLN